MVTNFNLSESSAALAFDALCKPYAQTGSAAIDDFYALRDRVLHVAFVEPFSRDQQLKQLLVLAICSSAEAYFRRMISEIVAICPLAKEVSAGQMVAMGAVDSFSNSDLGLAISDTQGITSVGEIAKRTRNILGVSIKPESSVGVAIAEFEQVCQLRHAIVHSGGELLFANRRELKVSKPGRLLVDLDDPAFQLVLQRVVNVVRAYNNFLANEVVTRWFVNNVLVGVWGKDKKKFESVYACFRSATDGLPSDGPKELYKVFKQKLST